MVAFRLSLGALVLSTVCGDHTPNRYTVDLDVPPEHRWDFVVAAERETMLQTLDIVVNHPEVKEIMPMAKTLIGNTLEARRILMDEHFQELTGIAQGMGVEVAELVVMSAFYDLFAAAHDSKLFKGRACTGVVAQTASGDIFHGRNLDYAFHDALAKATLVIDFARNGTTLFTAVTFGPSPVFNTAVKYGSFSVSQNERDRGSRMDNLFDILILGRAALFSDIRHAMETLETFEDAVDFFSEVKLSAAAYFILGGVKAGEAAVITRDRGGVADLWRMDANPNSWYVLETNYDRTTQPPFGDNRRAPLQRQLDALGPANFDAAAMWKVISVNDVNATAGERAPLNDETIYSTVMQASSRRSFSTVVRTSADALDSIVV